MGLECVECGGRHLRHVRLLDTPRDGGPAEYLECRDCGDRVQVAS